LEASLGKSTHRDFLGMIFKTIFRFTGRQPRAKKSRRAPLGDIGEPWRVVTSGGTLLLLVSRNSGTQKTPKPLEPRGLIENGAGEETRTLDSILSLLRF
jgi:hypothetical protein